MKSERSTVPRARVLELARFVGAGAVNTGVGYGTYLLLLHWLGYELAYAATYAVGIGVAYLLNSLYVFRRPLALRTALSYPLVYLAQYAVGALLLYAMVHGLDLDRRWAALIALVLSVPVSFGLNRLALARR